MPEETRKRGFADLGREDLSSDNKQVPSGGA